MAKLTSTVKDEIRREVRKQLSIRARNFANASGAFVLGMAIGLVLVFVVISLIGAL